MQHLPLVLLALVPAALAGRAHAQSVSLQFPLTATYLQTHPTDVAATAAAPFDLSQIGATPGQWLRISTLGDYDRGPGGDTHSAMTCVFSATATLLAPTQHDRVPGAIAAGPTFVTDMQSWLANDIVQDFFVPWTWVRVPPGAAFLFFTTCEFDFQAGLWGDNVDPDNDFRIEIVREAPPGLLPGTHEHAQLRSAISPATPTAQPDSYTAPGNSIVVVEVHDIWGIRGGNLVALMGEVVATSSTPPGPTLPGLYLTAPVPLLATVLGTPAPQFSLPIPPGFSGLTVLLQGGFVAGDARNGLFMSTDMHMVHL